LQFNCYQNGGYLPLLGFLKYQFLTDDTVLRVNVYYTVPYFTPIGQAVAEILLVFYFSRWRPSTSL